MKTNAAPQPASHASPWRLLLVLVFIITLAVPFFNKATPTLFGFPFFYWYQMACVPIASLIIFLVFRIEDKGAEK
jgi:uncharacterized membrane protein YhdT